MGVCDSPAVSEVMDTPCLAQAGVLQAAVVSPLPSRKGYELRQDKKTVCLEPLLS